MIGQASTPQGRPYECGERWGDVLAADAHCYYLYASSSSSSMWKWSSLLAMGTWWAAGWCRRVASVSLPFSICSSCDHSGGRSGVWRKGPAVEEIAVAGGPAEKPTAGQGRVVDALRTGIARWRAALDPANSRGVLERWPDGGVLTDAESLRRYLEPSMGSRAQLAGSRRCGISSSVACCAIEMATGTARYVRPG